MKKLLLFMLLLTGALSFSPLKAQAVLQTGAWQAEAGWANGTVGGPIYALSSAVSGTVSSAVDLRNYAGVMVCITSTPGAPDIALQWSMDANASPAEPWFTGEQLPTNTTQPVRKMGNFLRFKVLGTSGNTPIYSSTALASTISYIPISASDGIQWQYSHSYSVATSGATNLNLTTTAGCASCNLLVTVNNLSGGGGLNYDIDTAATSATLSSSAGMQQVAGSGPLVFGPYAPGHVLHMLAVSSGATVYVRLEARP